MPLEKLQRALTEPNILWLPTPPENHFDSNQIYFYSNFGKVFPLAEFQAKLFVTQTWVGGFYSSLRIQPPPIAHRRLGRSAREASAIRSQKFHTDDVESKYGDKYFVRTDVKSIVTDHLKKNSDTSLTFARLPTVEVEFLFSEEAVLLSLL